MCVFRLSCCSWACNWSLQNHYLNISQIYIYLHSRKNTVFLSELYLILPPHTLLPVSWLPEPAEVSSTRSYPRVRMLSLRAVKFWLTHWQWTVFYFRFFTWHFPVTWLPSLFSLPLNIWPGITFITASKGSNDRFVALYASFSLASVKRPRWLFLY